MKMDLKLTDLTVTRTIRATPEEIYDVWLDKTSPGGPWYGSKKVIVDPVVDGLFFTAVEHEQKYFAHYGRFVTLERGKKIEHTWVSPATKGVESTVTLTFSPKDGGTEVNLVHSNVPDDDDGRMHAEGWAWVLGCVAERLERSK